MECKFCEKIKKSEQGRVTIASGDVAYLAMEDGVLEARCENQDEYEEGLDSACLPISFCPSCGKYYGKYFNDRKQILYRDAELKNVDGLDIPLLEITEGEAELDITVKRLMDYNMTVGQNVMEYTLAYCTNHKVLIGYLINFYPECEMELINAANKDCGIMEIQSILEDRYGLPEDNIPIYYQHFCDFVNKTKITKKKVNQQLISTELCYKK